MRLQSVLAERMVEGLTLTSLQVTEQSLCIWLLLAKHDTTALFSLEKGALERFFMLVYRFLLWLSLVDVKAQNSFKSLHEFPLQKMKIDCSVCNKHSTTERFDLSDTGIQLDFKQFYYLDNQNKVQHLSISDSR